MSGQRTAVTFQGLDGRRLFGILHRPEGARTDRPGIVLLSPGVKARVAPHRLYLAMTDLFVELGYPVLRFDFSGLGDSEGEISEDLLADLYGAIQVGRYIDDTVAAMDWMEREVGISRFVASGLCGGAITGLLAGVQDRRIVGLVGLAIPVILDGSHIDSDRYLSAAQLRGKRAGYLRKLTTPEAWRSWLRFLTGRSDYRLIARALAAPLLARPGATRPAPAAEAEAAVTPADNTNPLFAPSLFSLLESDRRVLLVFAGADRLWLEYSAKFVARHQERLGGYDHSRYAVHVTEDANHIFSFPAWQEDMLTTIAAWVRLQRDW